jgi:hypothetical protein
MTNENLDRVLYRQKQFPIFQNRMYDTAIEARSCQRGDIVLVEDKITGLIYNSAFRSELMEYDGRYQNEQAISPYFEKHLGAVASIVERTIGKNSLIEVGCGKAFFLELLNARGFDITGFDPTYEGNSPRVRRRYFEADSGMNVEGLILRHVLEHISSPYNFLKNLKYANGGQGEIYIEVPCFEWILQKKAWYDIFYEHVNYFRLSDLQCMFDEVIEYGRFFGDQYIYIVADLSSLKNPEKDSTRAVQFPDDFIDRVCSISSVRKDGAVVWGGASKGVIFSLMRERVGQPIVAVIDINPAKQGKYLPATGLLVESPDDVLARLNPKSTIYVMNSNYMEEIRGMSRDIFDYVGVEHG